MANTKSRQANQVVPVTREIDQSAREILEFQTPAGALTVAPVSFAARRVTWLIVSLFVACMLVIGFFPIDQVVSAPGQIISLTPTVVMQPLQTAIVRTINVQPHQIVHKGDIVATLDPTFSAADLAQYEAQVHSYKAEDARDKAELAGVPYNAIPGDHDSEIQAQLYQERQANLKASLAEYDQKIASLQNSLAQAEADARGYAGRLGVANDVESIQRQLEKMNVGSKLTTLSSIDARMEMARLLGDALAQVPEARANMNAQIDERAAFLANWRSQISQDIVTNGRSLSDAEQALKKAQLVNQLVVLRAPQDAEVLTIASVSVGSVLQSGDPLITLVPLNAKFAIQANVLGSDIGYVQPGQAATIKFNTFQYTEYGVGRGKVLSISPDSFISPSGVGPNNQVGGVASNSMSSSGTPVTTSSTANSALPNSLSAGMSPLSYYETQISIDKLNLIGIPKGFHLVPGLPLSVDIKVGNDTILEYLLNRVIPIIDTSMREPW